LNEVGRPDESAREELRRARTELARLADVERELVFWRARAQAAEAIAAQWRTVQNRTLWKLFAALDQLRARVVPARTRRERIVLGAAHSAARVMAPLGRARRTGGERFVPKARKDVLFVYDEPGAWKLYRCDHQAEQLRYLGMSCDIARSDGVDLVGALDFYDTFVLNRVDWSERISVFAEAARDAEKRVVFDTDDLIFEPELTRNFAFLDDVSESVRETWQKRLHGFQATLVACDSAIVSTEPLAAYARRRVARVDVVYNAVSSQMIQDADAALDSRSHAEREADGRLVTIGYLSGTPSHNRDFLEAADGVLWALRTYPDVRVLVVGQLDLDQRFKRFGDRVMTVPKQPFDALPTLIARIDINLAPLEPDNPVAECKSCVKYLEAGLVGVPTIASARPDFARVIESGQNGLLADHASDWQDALCDLIESTGRRRTMGALAREDVRENHKTKAAATRLEHALVGSHLGCRRAVGTAHES
jgi:glycosyltransferase involved in cell wall biosynthesis